MNNNIFNIKPKVISRGILVNKFIGKSATIGEVGTFSTTVHSREIERSLEAFNSSTERTISFCLKHAPTNEALHTCIEKMLVLDDNQNIMSKAVADNYICVLDKTNNPITEEEYKAYKQLLDFENIDLSLYDKNGEAIISIIKQEKFSDFIKKLEDTYITKKSIFAYKRPIWIIKNTDIIDISSIQTQQTNKLGNPSVGGDAASKITTKIVVRYKSGQESIIPPDTPNTNLDDDIVYVVQISDINIKVAANTYFKVMLALPSDVASYADIIDCPKGVTFNKEECSLEGYYTSPDIRTIKVVLPKQTININLMATSIEQKII